MIRRSPSCWVSFFCFVIAISLTCGYVAAQNTTTTIGSPGSTGSSFAKTAGDAALARIAQAVAFEPCGGLVNKDSSQACKTCGAVNYIPYQSCGTAQPVPFCQ